MSKGECFLMSDQITVEVTKEQRDILLQGLRYVRSSIMLDFHAPDPEFDRERQQRKEAVEICRLAGTSRCGHRVAQFRNSPRVRS